MPTREQLERGEEAVARARERLGPKMEILWVLPDYYEELPKPCMGGWAHDAIVIQPNGDVLPCQAAATIPGLEVENVRERSLSEIWFESEMFERFRGTDWMREPCRSCPARPAGAGLRRLPLPGARAHRRRRRDRSRVPPLAPPPRGRRGARGRARARAGPPRARRLRRRSLLRGRRAGAGGEQGQDGESAAGAGPAEGEPLVYRTTHGEPPTRQGRRRRQRPDDVGPAHSGRRDRTDRAGRLRRRVGPPEVLVEDELFGAGVEPRTSLRLGPPGGRVSSAGRGAGLRGDAVLPCRLHPSPPGCS